MGEARTTVRIGLEWFLNPDHLPFLVAMEQGWCEQEGFQLELIEPTDHLDAFDALQTGAVDVAITEPIHLVQDRARGRPVVAFARFLHTNGGVMYFGGRGIERPRDMAGRRVQYPGAPGPGGTAIVSTMIEADGGRAEGLVPVDHGFQHTEALVTDLADVATLVFYNFEVVEARHQGHDARFFALKDWGVPDFCQLILVASEQRLHHEGERWRALARILSRSLDFIHQHPDEAQRVYWARTRAPADDPLLRSIFDATVPCFTFDLGMSPQYYARLSQWLVGRGVTERAVDPEGCFDSRFVY
jgi:ABC-type nitrate/sulfonate/bicarbonate transport system substrate-binding protein